MSTFDRAFAFTVEAEKAVYTNDPRDSGGPTKYGVTLRAYASFLGREVSPEEIQALTEEQAKAFYLARYWTPLCCDLITNPAIALCLFDAAVLNGVGTSALLAQEALSTCSIPLKFDGHIGDKSIAGFNAVREEEFLQAFHGLLLHRIDSVIALNPKNEVFRKGWINRANRLLTLSGVNPQNREVT